MAHRFGVSSLLLVSAALASSGASPRPATAGGTLCTAPCAQPKLEILVDGVPRSEYALGETRYIEALKNREYAIRLTNPYPVRVAVALSVDGLNSIDARHTSAREARKWVLDPYASITLSGWQVSSSEARRFVFTTEARSYGQALGKTENLGVISAVFFRERATRLQRVPVQASPPSPQPGRAGSAEASAQAAKVSDEYAATGIGRRADHAVREISIDLEETPAATIAVRYEYRAQLARLGINVGGGPGGDPLERRERARGFANSFCPEPKR